MDAYIAPAAMFGPIPELNGALTRTAAFRMTICAVEQFD